MSFRELMFWKQVNRWERSPGARPSRRRARRPDLEPLEKREVMTVVFEPHFGAETIFWRTNVAGQPAGSALTGPVSNTTALQNPTVYFIFWGTSWAKSAPQLAGDAAALLQSPYLSGLKQYGSSGTATYGGYTIDNSPAPIEDINNPNPVLAARDAEIQKIVPTMPGWAKPTGSSAVNAPVYAVVLDNGGWGENQVSTYSPGKVENALLLGDGNNNPDTFTLVLSHELAERMSDGTGQGIGMNGPVGIPGDGEYKNAQISDNEPDASRYLYREGGSLLVQAYWSVVDQAFIVPDGNQQRVVLTPIWNGTTFTFQYDLLAVDDALTNTLPGAPLSAQKTALTLGNETFNFASGQIRNVTVYTLGNTGGVNQVWKYTGSGPTWTPITGTNTHVSQLVNAGNTLYMRAANNGGVNQVWQYSGAGTNWTPITGTNTGVFQIAASGNSIYMRAENDAIHVQIWKYTGSGTNWTPLTGTNTVVGAIAAADSGLYMYANNGPGWQVWQYSGTGTNWTAVTGLNTTVYSLASTGGSLYMFARYNGVNQIWRYSGLGTNWTPVTGTNTNVDFATGMVVVGDRLFMLANNGGVNQVWQYSGAGTNWTPITGTNTTVYSLQAIGNGLYMVTLSNGVRQVWEYSGSGTVWNPVAANDPTYLAGP
jgi:hypothetical protein